jgi:hypothetical protein
MEVDIPGAPMISQIRNACGSNSPHECDGSSEPVFEQKRPHSHHGLRAALHSSHELSYDAVKAKK